MYCVNCGTNNQDGVRFCAQCGEALQSGEFAAVSSGGQYGPARAYGTVQEGGGPQRAYADLGANQGFFTPFINMWKNYVNFKDRTGVRGYWMAVLVYFIVGVAVAVLMGLCMAVGFYTLSGIISVLFALFSLAAVCPSLAIVVRRLRDAGRPWPWIFISFIPLAGSIILIVLLCGRSVPDDGTPVV